MANSVKSFPQITMNAAPVIIPWSIDRRIESVKEMVATSVEYIALSSSFPLKICIAENGAMEGSFEDFEEIQRTEIGG